MDTDEANHRQMIRKNNELLRIRLTYLHNGASISAPHPVGAEMNAAVKMAY
jgi:hypothetical protein